MLTAKDPILEVLYKRILTMYISHFDNVQLYSKIVSDITFLFLASGLSSVFSLRYV